MKTRATVLFGLLTALCIAAVFFNCLIKGAPVSRFDLISRLDLIANPSLAGSPISVAQDPSACLQSIPKETFVRKSLTRLQSPIWNPQSGCGQPLVADPANTLWSPIDLVFAPTNQRLYNIGIIFKIILGGVFSYVFFLRSGATPWAACSAALGFALAARVLRGVELATDFEILPAVFLLFQEIRPRANLKQLCMCGLGLALCYTALHPEVYFIAVVSAAALYLFDQKEKALISDAITALGKTALIALCLVAPFLLPFIEYLCYAHSYKYDSTSMEFIPLSALPTYLGIPRMAGTLFPGWITLLGLPLGLISYCRTRKALYFVLLLLVLFACRPAPLDSILGHPPFSFLLPEYALGTILLLLCLIAANGLSKLNELQGKGIPLRIGVAVASLIIAVAPALYLGFTASPLLSQKALLSSIAVILAAAVLVLCFNLKQKSLFSANIILMLALPLLNLSTLVGPVRAELPDTSIVKLPAQERTDLMTLLQSQPFSRITACGAGLLAPSTNLLYGLSDLRTCSPLNNVRYLKYMQKLGASLGYCNMIEVPTKLNRLIDLASVQLLLSSSPLRSADFAPHAPGIRPDLSAAAMHSAAAGRIMPGMRLLSAECVYDQTSAEIEVHLMIRIHQNLADRYHAQVVLKDSKDKILWRGPIATLAAAQGEQKHAANLDWVVPAPIAARGQVSVVLLIHDAWTGELLKPDGATLSKEPAEPGVLLASYELKSSSEVASNDGRFVAVFETPDLIRLYRNNSALPRAYLVHKLLVCDSGDASLDELCKSDFNTRNSAVIEREDRAFPPINPFNGFGNASFGEKVEIIKSSNTAVKLRSTSNSTAFLVLTDLYYPGWTASVDNNPVQIFRTNYLFRGIAVPKGIHTITFHYVPLSLCLGLIAALLSILVALKTLLRTDFAKRSE